MKLNGINGTHLCGLLSIVEYWHDLLIKTFFSLKFTEFTRQFNCRAAQKDSRRGGRRSIKSNKKKNPKKSLGFGCGISFY